MPVPAEVADAMRRTNESFGNDVIGSRRINALDEIYARDAWLLPPEAPMVRGRDAAKDFWRKALDSISAISGLQTVEAEMCGDGIVEIGTTELTLADGSFAKVKYIVHWKQENGRWVWQKDIWNLY